MKINIQTFFEKKDLRFKTDRHGINWVKRNLSPRYLLRVGPNYLVDDKEMERLFNDFIKRQEELSQRRAAQAKKLVRKRKRRKMKNTEVKSPTNLEDEVKPPTNLEDNDF